MNVLSWVILVAVLMILGPVITIWSLNTLFPVLNIPYTMETWAAAGVLFGSAIWKTKD
jgi:hypothetical protein